jgi:hypothetical protein
MRTIPSITGPDCLGETSGKDRDLTNAFTGKDEYQEIIRKAETYPLVKIFKKYHINIDTFSRKTICPFPSHKGGKESTASFYFYPETNTFWCFGCKAGRTSVDFVSKIESITKVQSAIKIIKNSESDFQFESNIQGYQNDYDEKNKLHFSFSKQMRDIISKNKESLSEIEKIYSIFDKMNNKYELELKALQLLVERLNSKIEKI